MIAEYKIAVGVLRFCRQPSHCLAHVVRLRTRPSKVKHGISLLSVDGDLEHKLRSIVQGINSLERLAAKLAAHLTEQIANGLLGGVHDGAHVKVNSLETLLVDELFDKNSSAMTGCDLGV